MAHTLWLLLEFQQSPFQQNRQKCSIIAHVERCAATWTLQADFQVSEPNDESRHKMLRSPAGFAQENENLPSTQNLEPSSRHVLALGHGVDDVPSVIWVFVDWQVLGNVSLTQ